MKEIIYKIDPNDLENVLKDDSLTFFAKGTFAKLTWNGTCVTTNIHSVLLDDNVIDSTYKIKSAIYELINNGYCKIL